MRIHNNEQNGEATSWFVYNSVFKRMDGRGVNVHARGGYEINMLW